METGKLTRSFSKQEVVELLHKKSRIPKFLSKPTNQSPLTIFSICPPFLPNASMTCPPKVRVLVWRHVSIWPHTRDRFPQNLKICVFRLNLLIKIITLFLILLFGLETRRSKGKSCINCSKKYSQMLRSNRVYCSKCGIKISSVFLKTFLWKFRHVQWLLAWSSSQICFFFWMISCLKCIFLTKNLPKISSIQNS